MSYVSVENPTFPTGGSMRDPTVYPDGTMSNTITFGSTVYLRAFVHRVASVERPESCSAGLAVAPPKQPPMSYRPATVRMAAASSDTMPCVRS